MIKFKGNKSVVKYSEISIGGTFLWNSNKYIKTDLKGKNQNTFSVNLETGRLTLSFEEDDDVILIEIEAVIKERG